MQEYIEEVEMDIDVDKIYQMPKYVIKRYKDNILVIAINNGKWLVFSSNLEMEIFEFLANRHSIIDALNEFDEEEVVSVLSQVEAKKFTEMQCNNIDNAETMQIYLTNACNLRCKHCYMYADAKLEDELTENEILELCRLFKENGGRYVTLTGGEVSVRHDFVKILCGINDIGLGIHILSNGVLWSEELISTVINIKPERVQISLDGFNEKSNAMIRGAGNFAKVLETIDKLVTNNVNVYVAVTPLYEVVINNKDEYIQFAKNLVEKYKGYNFLINFSFELIEGREIKHIDIDTIADKYLKIMREICEEVYPGAELEGFIENHNNNKIFNNCGYGRINISPIGDIYFCSRITEVKKYANFRDDSFEKIKKLMERARQLSDLNSLTPCKECELKYICGGGCRVDEFNSLTVLDDLFEENASSKIEARSCSKDNKEYLYKMMIDSNERMYE